MKQASVTAPTARATSWWCWRSVHPVEGDGGP